MKNKTVNIPASVHAKLKNKADEAKQPFQEILQYYGMERFLYRLSRSRYSNDFVLKGGLMIYGLGIPMRRPTRDIDFLGNMDETMENISSIIRDVLSSSVPDDGIKFDIDTLRILETQIDANRNGLRVTFTGFLGNARIPMQIDVGYSDELATTALDIDYPVLLVNMEAPRLRGYPPEAIVSEKLHAIVHFAELNSRWKDYYDIWLISNTFEFESHKLEEAIQITFNTRATKIPSVIPPGLTDDFSSVNQENWKSFLYKNRFQHNDIEEFKSITSKIWHFLEYPLHEIKSNKQVKGKHWFPGKGWS